MKNNSLRWAICSAVVVVLVVGAGVLATPRMPEHFSGVINDYSPASVTPSGPWEIRGPWSVKLKDESGKADFSPAMTMELSDYSRNPSNPHSTSGSSSRMQPTHHITIEDGTVTPLPTGGFEVSGPVTITKDGSPAPLASSMLFVDITGGTNVEFSNVTLRFEGGATIHFGSQLIHGVVRNARDEHR